MGNNNKYKVMLWVKKSLIEKLNNIKNSYIYAVLDISLIYN